MLWPGGYSCLHRGRVPVATAPSRKSEHLSAGGFAASEAETEDTKGQGCRGEDIWFCVILAQNSQHQAKPAEVSNK